MKKLLIFVLTTCMLLTSFVSVFADYDVSVHQDTHIVYLEGQSKIESATDGFVTILIKDSNDKVAHIGQYKTDSDGNYYAKFKLESNDSAFTYSVKEGSSAVDANVNLAKITTEPVVIDVAIANELNGGKYITEDSVVKSVMNIKNKYSDSTSFKLVFSFYDEAGRLLKCKISDAFSVDFNEVDIAKEFTYGTLPENTYKIKAFAWADEVTLRPMSNAAEETLNDSIFGDDNEKVTVAFFGDSITHGGQQQKFIETYYKTKYPDREIEFLNKGINGDEAVRIVNRFDFDVMNDLFSNAPQEAALMIGMNDIQRAYYTSASSVSDEKKQAEIDDCLENIEVIIKLCKDNNVSLTLVTPSLYDEGDYKGGSSDNAVGANAALGKVGEGVKVLAAKYELPVIDLHTATNYWTDKIRENEEWKTNPVIIPSDRIHPGQFGGFIMGYEYAKQQGNSGLVASVSIDALNKSFDTQNAKISNLVVNDNGLTYTYKAGSLPMAYTSDYITAETYGIPVTEDINNEIIKVNGLASGNYVVKMNGNALSKVYSAEELANGINIAIEANNPGQITAKTVNNKVLEKVTLESNYRIIAFMESVAARYGFDITNEKETADWLETMNDWKSYYVNNLNSYNKYKPIQAETWKQIKDLDAKANALAVTSEITVSIELQ